MTEAEAPRPSAVNALADTFWQGYLELSPLTATIYGDERFDDRLPDPTPAGRAAARSHAEATLRAAAAIPEAGLDVEERITLDMLRVAAELRLEELDQRFDVLGAVDQMDGGQTLLPELAVYQAADTPERLERFVARVRAYPAFLDATGELAREGVATGLVQPRIIVERTIAQIERLLATPVDEHPLVAVTRVAGAAERERLADLLREVVRPAEARFLAIVRDEVLPVARPEPGIWAVPGGEAIYHSQIRSWTTLVLEPEAVHAVGLEELARIEEERRVIARAAGFGDDTAAYRRAAWADPSDRPKSREAMVERAYEDIERANAAASRWFGRTPLARCEVRAVEAYKEADAPSAYYMSPSVDGSRPGTYWVNTYDLPSRSFSSLASATYHEAVPGHHFQIALEMELPGLPDFRRLGSRLVGGAYAEGWGLYSERLADEMGLYRNEQERFGMLDAQAWRAGRLIVDTGLHALRWTRQQAIDQLLACGLTETNATIETDRYTLWPGQALTYMVGRREFDRLRAEATERARATGSSFDLRAFHDAALGHGALPLATLAAELPRWLPER